MDNIQRRLRDQELLYEQLILEEELRELSEKSQSHLPCKRSEQSPSDATDDEFNHLFSTNSTVSSQPSRQQRELDPRLHGLAGDVTQLTSSLPQTTSTEVGNDLREKLRSAQEAEKHWNRVKTEQRMRLQHVIYDVTTRKEIEEVYFNAQVQLCRARREIRTLSESYPGFASSPSGHDVIGPKFTPAICDSAERAQDFAGKHGAF